MRSSANWLLSGFPHCVSWSLSDNTHEVEFSMRLNPITAATYKIPDCPHLLLLNRDIFLSFQKYLCCPFTIWCLNLQSWPFFSLQTDNKQTITVVLKKIIISLRLLFNCIMQISSAFIAPDSHRSTWWACNYGNTSAHRRFTINCNQHYCGSSRSERPYSWK